MSEAKKEMDILMPEPIKITLGGQAFSVNKMSVRKQFQTGALFEEKPAEGMSEKDVMADRMIKVISIVTGIAYEKIDECCSVAEVSEAFKAIWAQNGFDRFTQKPAGEAQA